LKPAAKDCITGTKSRNLEWFSMVLKRKVKRFKNLVVAQNGALKFINPNQPATPAARHSGIEKGRRIGGVGEGD